MEKPRFSKTHTKKVIIFQQTQNKKRSPHKHNCTSNNTNKRKQKLLFPFYCFYGKLFTYFCFISDLPECMYVYGYFIGDQNREPNSLDLRFILIWAAKCVWKTSEGRPSLKSRDSSPQGLMRDQIDTNHPRLYSGKARALGTSCIPPRGRGVHSEEKWVPVFIGPQWGK